MKHYLLIAASNIYRNINLKKNAGAATSIIVRNMPLKNYKNKYSNYRIACHLWDWFRICLLPAIPISKESLEPILNVKSPTDFVETDLTPNVILILQ